jgi:hypothetical protein
MHEDGLNAALSKADLAKLLAFLWSRHRYDDARALHGICTFVWGRNWWRMFFVSPLLESMETFMEGVQSGHAV